MDSAVIDQTSEQFLGQWKRLVSTTNWEKGRIINEWRLAVSESGAPSQEFSDDAWSRRVANVTPQHVGRLRRVYERFADGREQYPGLFWSHFQAALDWNDAEMWLEGAVQNDWSISEMRNTRWESLGALAPDSGDADSADDDWDEDADRDEASGEVVSGTLGVVHAPERTEVEDFDATDDDFDHEQFEGDAVQEDRRDPGTADVAVRPFAKLPPLPADVNDAFEAYKLCILRHRLAGWQEISQSDLILSLDSLKQLTLAPAEA